MLTPLLLLLIFRKINLKQQECKVLTYNFIPCLILHFEHIVYKERVDFTATDAHVGVISSKCQKINRLRFLCMKTMTLYGFYELEFVVNNLERTR